MLRLLLTGLAESVASSAYDLGAAVPESIPKHSLDTQIMAGLPTATELEYRGETDFGVRVTRQPSQCC